MVEKALEKIGLTPGEIRVYLALLELGASTTGNITKKAHVSGSKVYEVLDRLIHKGIVSSVTKDGVKHFEAAHPTRILDYLNEKEDEIEKEKETIQKILPELLLKHHHTEKSEAKIYTGFAGIRTVNDAIVSSLKKGEEWLSMGLSEQPKAWERYFNKRQKDRAKKGVKIRHLLNEQYSSLVKEREKLPYTQFRFLPRSFSMPTSTEIYKNNVALLILVEENPFAILIENKAVADSFRKYFEIMWKQVNH